MSFESVNTLTKIDDANENEVAASSENVRTAIATDEIMNDNSVTKFPIPSRLSKDNILSNVKALPWDSYTIGFLAIIGALIAWQLLSFYQVKFILSFENIPTPVIVGEQFIKLIVTKNSTNISVLVCKESVSLFLQHHF